MNNKFIESFGVVRNYPLPSINNLQQKKGYGIIENKLTPDVAASAPTSNDITVMQQDKMSYIDLLNRGSNPRDMKFDFANDFIKQEEHADDYYNTYDVFTKDADILRNIRINNDVVLSNFQEIDFYQMYDILKKTRQYVNRGKNNITCDFKYPVAMANADDMDKRILSFLIIIINKFYIKSNYFNKYHRISPFRVENYTIYSRDYCHSDKVINYKLNIHIGRHEYSVQKFVIAVDIVVKNGSLTNLENIYLTTLEVIGIYLEQNNGIKSANNMNTIDNKNEEKYKCFYLGGELPRHNGKRLNCESYHPEINTIGVFDKPCEQNTDCPYNSPLQNRGGCGVDGYCEMPYGITQIGFTKIYKNSSPLCYNGACNGNNYVFIGDTKKNNRR